MYQFLCFYALWLAHTCTGKFGISCFIFHQIFSLMHHWSKWIMWLSEYSPAKTAWFWKLWNVTQIFPNFQNCACCQKYLKVNKHNNLYFAQTRGQIHVVVLGHYLFLSAHSFPSTFSENCLLLGTDNVCWEISKHTRLIVFSCQMEAIYLSSTYLLLL